MRTYLNQSSDADDRMQRGWFKTRDTGYFDDNGDLNITGRLDNIFSVGHEKVSPEEIEDVLAQLPGIDEVAVSSVPHHLPGSQSRGSVRQRKRHRVRHSRRMLSIVIARKISEARVACAGTPAHPVWKNRPPRIEGTCGARVAKGRAIVRASFPGLGIRSAPPSPPRHGAGSCISG